MTDNIDSKTTDQIKQLILHKLGGTGWTIENQSADIQDWEDPERRMNILVNNTASLYHLTYFRKVMHDNVEKMELFLATAT